MYDMTYNTRDFAMKTKGLQKEEKFDSRVVQQAHFNNKCFKFKITSLNRQKIRNSHMYSTVLHKATLFNFSIVFAQS